MFNGLKPSISGQNLLSLLRGFHPTRLFVSLPFGGIDGMRDCDQDQETDEPHPAKEITEGEVPGTHKAKKKYPVVICT